MEDVKGKKADEKFCCRCRQFVSLTGFHKDRNRADGLKYICKSCIRLVSKKRYKSRKELSEREGYCIRYNCRFKAGKPGGLCAMHFFKTAASSLKNPGIWKELEELAEKEDYVCVLTGDKLVAGVNMSLDHIKPISKYPELVNDLDNMQWVTKWANISKYDITVKDFILNCSKVVKIFEEKHKDSTV